MSYTMTHLVIADYYRKLKQMPSDEANVFLLASVGADSVHRNENYSKAMKEKSHIFPEELVWGDIYLEEQMDKWYENIKAFYETKKTFAKTSLEKAFLEGYLLHLLVDIFNCAYIYAPNLIGYGMDVEGFRRDYREQCLKQDQNLYQQYKYTSQIFEDLEKAVCIMKEFDILENLNLEAEINVYSLEKHVKHDKQIYESIQYLDMEKTTMITEKITNNFIRDVGKICVELLFSFPEKKGLFQVNVNS